MPSFEIIEARNTARLDGTYTEDLSGAQAWKGRKSKGMERQPEDIESCCHALRFSLISKLDGTKLNLNDSGCLPIKEGLTMGVARNTLESIYLWKNGIGEEGMRALAKPLAAIPRLKHLNLYRNRLGDKGSANLCKQISVGLCASTLHTLWLSDNNIHTFPQDILNISGLVRLFISQNKIKSVPKELALLESLTMVDLDHNPLEGLPGESFYTGMRRLPGPRWDLLRPHFRTQMGLDLPDEDADMTPRPDTVASASAPSKPVAQGS